MDKKHIVINKKLENLQNKQKVWEIKQITIINVKRKSWLIEFQDVKQKETTKLKIMYTKQKKIA